MVILFSHSSLDLEDFWVLAVAITKALLTTVPEFLGFTHDKGHGHGPRICISALLYSQVHSPHAAHRPGLYGRVVLRSGSFAWGAPCSEF